MDGGQIFRGEGSWVRIFPPQNYIDSVHPLPK